MRSVASGLVLLLSACAQLPVRSEPMTQPPDSVRVVWTDSRPGAEPWFVLPGDGVEAVRLDPERRTLAWRAQGRDYVVVLQVKHNDVTGREGEAGRHAMCVEPIAGFTNEGLLIVEGSPVPVATPVDDKVVEFRYPNRSTLGIPGTVRARSLRVTSTLSPEDRARAHVVLHDGFDLRLNADGTIEWLDRALPDGWELASGLPYPGEVVLEAAR